MLSLVCGFISAAIADRMLASTSGEMVAGWVAIAVGFAVAAMIYSATRRKDPGEPPTSP